MILKIDLNLFNQYLRRLSIKTTISDELNCITPISVMFVNGVTAMIE